MEDRIIQIIEDLTDYRGLQDNKDMDLLDNEILDSLAFIELLSQLEEEFQIEIQPTQIKPETWRKVERITALVKSLQHT